MYLKADKTTPDYGAEVHAQNQGIVGNGNLTTFSFAFFVKVKERCSHELFTPALTGIAVTARAVCLLRLSFFPLEPTIRRVAGR